MSDDILRVLGGLFGLGGRNTNVAIDKQNLYAGNYGLAVLKAIVVDPVTNWVDTQIGTLVNTPVQNWITTNVKVNTDKIDGIKLQTDEIGTVKTTVLGLPTLNTIVGALPTINMVNTISNNLLSRPILSDIETSINNHLGDWMAGISVDVPFARKAVNKVLSDTLTEFNTVYEQETNPFPTLPLVDMDNMFSAQEKEDYLKLDIHYLLYMATKSIIDALYGAMLTIANELSEMAPLEINIIIPIPSGAGIQIAEKIGGVWTVPDFRMGPYTADSKTLWIKVWDVVFKLPIFNLPNFSIPDLIWPKLSLKLRNRQLSDADLYWRVDGEFVKGSTIGRYYMLSDMIIDTTVAVLVIAITSGLVHFGLPKVNDLFRRSLQAGRTNPWTPFEVAKTTLSTAAQATTIVSKLASLDDEDLSDMVGSVENLTGDLTAMSAQISTIANNLQNIVSIDDITTLKTELLQVMNSLVNLIGLRVQFN